MKKAFVIVVLLANLALLVSVGRLFCYEGEVEDISGSKYFPAVKKAITEARESIYMVMFKVGLRPYDESSSVYQLVEELVNAHKRGELARKIGIPEATLNRWLRRKTNISNAYLVILKKEGII